MVNEQLSVDLRQMILAIETAVSLVGMNDVNHGKRVGYIALQIGRELGFSDEDCDFLFELGLLHDCGVSTEQMHSTLVNYFDWEDAKVHCEIGHVLLKDFEPLSCYALPIRHHHTRWQELKTLDISPRDKRMANIIFLADRVDISAAKHYANDILLAREQIAERFDKTYRDDYFDSELVDAFLAVQQSEAFWIALEDRHVTRFTWDMGQRSRSAPLTMDQLRQLSMILSFVVDQKSPFTAEHSVRVADVARYLATLYGMSELQIAQIEIAALLHDLGKLHTPDNILEKAGPLNPLERSIMNQHSYETFEILRPIKGLEEIAVWAAYHHEGLNGRGYPFHPDRRELSSEARVIAVADVLQALVQDRPYRKGMPMTQVLEILDKQAADKRLDAAIVALVHAEPERCYAVARGEDAFCNQDYDRLLDGAARVAEAA